MQPILLENKLPHDIVDIPVPRYFTEDRAKELDQRNKLLVYLGTEINSF
jgi:hypothetical protein